MLAVWLEILCSSPIKARVPCKKQMDPTTLLVRAMRDYVMGEPHAPKPEQMKDSNLLNPALL